MSRQVHSSPVSSRQCGTPLNVTQSAHRLWLF